MLVFSCKFFALPFSAFLLEHSLTSQVTFSSFRSSFSLYVFLICSHCIVIFEVKLKWLFLVTPKQTDAKKPVSGLAEWIFHSNLRNSRVKGVSATVGCLAILFLFTCCILILIFTSLFIFFSEFSKCFSNPLLVYFRSSCLLFNENSLNCRSGLVLICFFVSSSDALFSFYIYEYVIDFYHAWLNSIFLINLQLNSHLLKRLLLLILPFTLLP